MKRVILVGCSKKKSPFGCLAQELYTSPLFRKRRRYAALAGDPWFILSAAYGLVEPRKPIRPYDVTMNDYSFVERVSWGEGVVHGLETRLGPLDGWTVEVHAGKLYVEPVMAALSGRDVDWQLPMQGLGIGQQLAWYKRRCPTCSGSMVSTSAGGMICGGYCANV